MATEQMEMLLKSDNKPGVLEITQLLNRLDTSEQKEMLLFIQGMIFAKACRAGNAKP